MNVFIIEINGHLTSNNGYKDGEPGTWDYVVFFNELTNKMIIDSYFHPSDVKKELPRNWIV